MNKQSTTQSTTQTVADSQPEPDSTVPLSVFGINFDAIRTDRASRFWHRQLVVGSDNGVSRLYAICNVDSVKLPDGFDLQATRPQGPQRSNVAFGWLEMSLS